MMNQIGTINKKRYAIGKVISLGSSSEGNAYYVEINRKGYPSPYKLLIEAGFKYNELVKRMTLKGIKIYEIDSILVTHEHHDHSIAVPKLLEYGMKVYAPESVYKHYDVMGNITTDNIIKANRIKNIADEIDVLGFELEHKNDDGSKTYNLGYIIKINSDYGIHNILFVTDTQYIRYNLYDYQFNTIFIEANNLTRNIIFALKQAQAKGDKFKEIHFDRVLHSHMLVENTIKTLIGTKKRNGFDLSKTDVIFLIHLTASGLANPQVIKNKVKDALIKNGKMRTVRKKGINYISPKVFLFKKNGEMI